MFILTGLILVLLTVFFFATYKVVPTNEAHVIVFMGRGRKVKTPVRSDDGRASTAYFYIPFLMQRQILPLTNVKLDIKNISLNDKKVAPFMCDVVTWVYINDPVLASERLDLTVKENIWASFEQDLIANVEAIARASAMKQEILEIMADRQTFATSVQQEVDPVLAKWGVELVNLEVNAIRDDENSNIIEDYEAMRKAEINSKSRIEIASRDREAVVEEQENKKQSEVATAEAFKTYTEKQVEADKAIGIANQQRDRDVSIAEQEANDQEVNALRVLEVGTAEVKKDATVVEAQGKAEAVRLEGQADAEVVRLDGNAEGDAIRAKGLAAAEAKDKMAEALQKFNDAATGIEKINAWKDVMTQFAAAYGKVGENADIKVVTSDSNGGNLLGLDMNAITGAGISQMIEAIGEQGVSEVIKKMTEEK